METPESKIQKLQQNALAYLKVLLANGATVNYKPVFSDTLKSSLQLTNKEILETENYLQKRGFIDWFTSQCGTYLTSHGISYLENILSKNHTSPTQLASSTNNFFAPVGSVQNGSNNIANVNQSFETHSNIKEGDILNNISINESTIGLFNAGQMENMNNISINISTLTKSGKMEIAGALGHVTKAVAENKEISETERSEVLEQLEEISNQAALLETERKRGIIRGLLMGIGGTLSAAGGLAEVWSTWGPAIRAYFGF